MVFCQLCCAAMNIPKHTLHIILLTQLAMWHRCIDLEMTSKSSGVNRFQTVSNWGIHRISNSNVIEKRTCTLVPTNAWLQTVVTVIALIFRLQHLFSRDHCSFQLWYWPLQSWSYVVLLKANLRRLKVHLSCSKLSGSNRQQRKPERAVNQSRLFLVLLTWSAHFARIFRSFEGTDDGLTSVAAPVASQRVT